MKTSTCPSALLCCFLLSVSSAALAADPAAVVIKSQNMSDYPVGKELQENAQISTQDSQKLAIKTVDGDTVAIGENAKFKLVKPGFFSHLFGKIYYFIRSRTGENNVQIESPVATLGIRGTKFVIASDEKDNAEVLLSEGSLDIVSNDEQPFEVSKMRELSDFEKFKLEQLREMQEINDEYEQYKKQLQQEFTEFKQSFVLEANHSLSFDGKKVSETGLTELQKQEIDEFEAFLMEDVKLD